MSLIGNMASALPFIAFRTFPKSGPVPPPALPGFLSTMGLSDFLLSPACPSRASGWSFVRPLGRISRVALWVLFLRASANTPAGPGGHWRSVGPLMAAFPFGVCAVKGVEVQWVRIPPGNWSFQPVAIRVVVEVTKP